jgi:hypothetical protein
MAEIRRTLDRRAGCDDLHTPGALAVITASFCVPYCETLHQIVQKFGIT